MVKALCLAASLLSLPAVAAYSIEKPKDHATGIAELEKAWNVKTAPTGATPQKWKDWQHVWGHVATKMGSDVLYILRDGTSVEGAMSVSSGGSTGDALVIQALVTAPKNLAPGGKQGAGSALAGAAIRIAQAEKLNAIELIPDNDGAESFWTKVGFKKSGKSTFDPWRLEAKDFDATLANKRFEVLTSQTNTLLAKEPVVTTKKKSAASQGCCIM
jgi:hypothetical protein